MRFKMMLESLQKLKSKNSAELLRELNIKVIEVPGERMPDEDALLYTGLDKSVIYIKSNLKKKYKEFLILHECGHRMLHYQSYSNYSFMRLKNVGRMEQEANIFACMFLLLGIDARDKNLIQLLVNKGVPIEAASIFYNYMLSKKDRILELNDQCYLYELAEDTV